MTMSDDERQKRIIELKEKIREVKGKKSSCKTDPKLDFQIMELEDELAELQAEKAQAG